MPHTKSQSREPMSAVLPVGPLPKPEVLLFDWHGTLVNTLDAMYRAIDDLLPQLEELDLVRRLTPEGMSKTPDDAKLVRFIRIFRRLRPQILAERRVSRTDIFDAIFGTDRDAIKIAHAAYDRCYRKHFGKVTPFEEGVRDHLVALRAVGIKVGVATNRSREFLGAELRSIEDGRWQGLFDTVVCGDEVKNRKPAPDVVLQALANLGIEPGPSTWFVGDGMADIVTARAAGVTSVFYNGALWDRDWFERMFPLDGTTERPSAIIDDFDQLLDLVEKAEDASGLRDLVRRSRPMRRPPRTPLPLHELPDWHPAVVDLTPPEIVLFDWHATLVDTLDAMYRAVDDTLPELYDIGLMERMVKPEESRSLDDKKLVEYVRSYRQLHPKIKADRKISRTDIFEVLFGNDEDAKRVAHATFNKHYGRHFGHVLPFEPHVKDVLIALRAVPLKVGVITNRDREFFAQELATVDGTGWESLFDTAVCGDDTIRRKPHPDQVALACKNLGAKLGPAVWYVGDSTTDVIAAKTAGITSVFFNGAQWDQPWLNKIFPGTERYPLKPDVVVNDFSEFWAMTLACLENAHAPL